LIQQNENAREVIGKQEKRITDLEAELAAEKENSASLGKSYESAKSEIVSLKQSNEALSRAVSINEQTIELLQADNAKQREKAKKANKEKWKARFAAAFLIAVQLIR
jgi:chromosome segregation ATPase